MPADNKRNRRTENERVDQARAAWLSLIDTVTGGHPGDRMTWTGEDAVAVLEMIGGVGQSVVGITSRLYGDRTTPERPQDVERFGEMSFDREGTPGDSSSVNFMGVSQRIRLSPGGLAYLPCPASPADGVFVVTVDDPVTAPPGHKLPFAAYLQSAAGQGQRPRWVAGGLVLANQDGQVEQSLLKAPSEVWFDFAALVRWVGRLLDTPPPRTTAEGLEDPAILDTLTEALSRHRQTEGGVRRGAKATQSDVDVIARTAIGIGLQPTVAMLTRVLGRGSATTLHPMLKAFYRRAVSEGLLPGAEAPPPSDLPPAFLDLLEQLRAAATAEVEAVLAPQRSALAEREAAASAREAALAAAQADLVREREQMTAAAEERDRALARLEADLTAARERIESLTHVERGQAQEIARVTAERDAEHDQRLAAGAARVEMATRLDQLHAQLTAAAEELSQERLAATRAAAAAAVNLAELTQQRAVAVTEAEHRRAAAADLSAQLADVRTRLADREHAVTDLQQRLQTLEEATARAQRSSAEDAVRAQETLAGKQSELDRALADLAAVSRERDRLDTLVRQLSADAPRPPSSTDGKRRRN